MSYREKYDEIKKLKAKPRGFAFEKLINEMFDDCKVLIKPSYKSVDQGQQIDGAIEINSKIFLLEAKWEKNKTLAASKLYSFIGKINSKLEGTLGIFISHNRLKENFVNAVRDGLRQNCILIHGEENIKEIIEANFNLKEYILYCYREASTRNVVEVSASEFISLVKNKGVPTTSSNELNTSNWPIIYEHLIDNSSLKDFIGFLQTVGKLGGEIPKNLISVLPHLSYSSLEKQKLNSLIESIKEDAKQLYLKAIVNKLTGDYWRKFSEREIVSIITQHNKFEQSDYNKIIRNVTKNFQGDWEIENDASRILDAIYDDFNFKNKKLTADKYLSIYVDSSRLQKFEQKQFADKVFYDLKAESNDLYKLFKDEIIEDLKNMKEVEKIWIEQGIGSEESMKETLLYRILLKYSKLIDSKNKDEVKSELSDKYDSL